MYGTRFTLDGTPLELGDAARADAPAIVALLADAFRRQGVNLEYAVGPAYVERRVAAMASPEAAAAYAVTLDRVRSDPARHWARVVRDPAGQVVGYAEALRTGPQAEVALRQLTVAYAWLGRGLAARLLASCLDWAGPVAHVCATALAYAERTLFFLRKHGFALVEDSYHSPDGVLPWVTLRRCPDALPAPWTLRGPRVLAPWPYPRLCAHRGGRLAPENTLAAVASAHQRGYRMIESDRQITADPEPISFLLHDATLERTTNGRGVAGQWPWEDLARLDAGAWRGREFAGIGLPTGAEVDRYCLAHGMMTNLEIKPPPGRDRTTGRVVARESRARFAGAAAPPLLSSFSDLALSAARDAAPELPRGLLMAVITHDWLERLERLDCIALIADHRVLSAPFVAEVKGLGYRVACYTANDPERVEALMGWGVDTVITDATDALEAG